jgi:hypothetical protein
MHTLIDRAASPGMDRRPTTTFWCCCFRNVGYTENCIMKSGVKTLIQNQPRIART